MKTCLGVLPKMQQWGVKHGGTKIEQRKGKGFTYCDGCRKLI